jgi:transposase
MQGTPSTFLGFLRHIEEQVPKDLDVHMIVDNYGTHKHARVKAWLARHPRFHLHYTPTYFSWLNQVELWFGLITQRAIRRGSFTSVTDLRRQIERFVADWNQHPHPFKWTATAESILARLERLVKLSAGQKRQQLQPSLCSASDPLALCHRSLQLLNAGGHCPDPRPDRKDAACLRRNGGT